jgi:glyoxylase-like metal-dependent hydrolase (beta-lactamase superfamily II)
MRPTEVLPGLFTIRSKLIVNVFWIVDGNSVTLIDTGLAGSADKILRGIAACGRQPRDVRDILVTHCHRDHAGSLAALKQRTGATTYMHPLDAELVRQGRCMRTLYPTPRFTARLMHRLLVGNARPESFHVEPVQVDREIGDGEDLPLAGGIRAIHAPGHCAGQLAFLWQRHGGVLFAADSAANVRRLNLSPVYEEIELGRQSLTKLSALSFENTCFGHGRPIIGGADREFRRLWPPSENPKSPPKSAEPIAERSASDNF